jgi:phage terminase small subunit
LCEEGRQIDSRTAKIVIVMALNLHQEAFVSHILAGKTAEAAYISAGYRTKSKEAARASGVRLAKHPEIQETLARARDEKARIHAEATKLAIERSAINLERVAVELGRIGFANMMDYMRVDQGGNPIIDFGNLTREQAAAITALHVSENGGIKFSLGDKRGALMDIAKLFGWIIDKRETKVVDEFDNMSDEQVEAWLDERAEARVKVRRRLSEDARRRTHRGRQPGSGGIGGGGEDREAGAG